MTLKKYRHIFCFISLCCLAYACSPNMTATKDNTPLDRSKAPEPGPAPEVNVGDYQSFQLDNGLTVFVVENHKLPYVSMSLALDLDPIQEEDKAGYVQMVGDMLRRGTQTRSKEALDEAIDFIGATLSTSGTGAYASSLTKHSDTLMRLVSDVLLHPSFPEEELEKVRTQVLSELVAAKSDPAAIANNIKTVLRYGKNDPYGEIETEETIKNITREDLVSYYQQHFKPSVAYLAVVGDITPAQARTLVEKYLGSWKTGKVPERSFEVAAAPKDRQVAIVDKPGAVQTVLAFTYPVALQMKDDDYLATVAMNEVLGGSFGSRLMQNLREDKAYTYGAYSALRPDERIGYFSAEAQVRTEVTDSAVTEFLHEMKRIKDEGITAEELEKAKKTITGRFARSLEDPRTVAQFATNTALYDLPDDFYEKYLQRIAALTLEEVNQAAQQYVNPDKTYIIAVGNETELSKKLIPFGKVTQYDMYGNPIVASKAADMGDMTADKVVSRYVEAIGGREKLENIEALRMKAEAEVQGMTIQMENTVTQKHQLRSEQKTPMGNMVQVYDGTKGYMVTPQGKQELTGAQLNMMKEQAMVFSQLHYQEQGYKTALTGTQEVNGSPAYVVKVTYPSGNKQTEYYDQKTGLLVKQDNAQGTVYFQDYTAKNGLQYPQKLIAETPMGNLEFNVTDYEIDPALEDNLFVVE